MNRFVSCLLLFVSCLYFFPVSSMELSPHAPSEIDENGISDVGRSLRLALHKRTADAIAQTEDDEKEIELNPQGINPALLKSAPADLINDLHRLYLQECYARLQSEYGIDRELVEKHFLEIKAEPAISDVDDFHYTHASSDLEKAATVLQRRLRCSPIKINRVRESTSTFKKYIGMVAFANKDGSISYLEPEIKIVAPSPASKEAVLAHEKMHIKNDDITFLLAVRRAFAQKGITYPTHFYNYVHRVIEVFAELMPCSFSAEAAAASARVSQRLLNLHGNIGKTHPYPADQIELATLTRQLHEEHAREVVRSGAPELRRRRLSLLSRRFNELLDQAEDEKKADKSS